MCRFEDIDNGSYPKPVHLLLVLFRKLSLQIDNGFILLILLKSIMTEFLFSLFIPIRAALMHGGRETLEPVIFTVISCVFRK